MIGNRKTLAGCAAIIAALALISCKQEKVESEKSVKIDLVCSLKFFEKGVDTGQWMDARLITIDGDILKIDPLPSTFKIISNLEHDKQDIVFEGAHSKGQINRYNGDLMLVDGKYVSLTGKCKKAVPLF